MIIFYSGVPGSGKTAYLVNQLRLAIKKGGDSPPDIYQHGIRDLKLAHTYLFCTSPQCKLCPDMQALIPEADRLYAADWDKLVPDGSKLVLDEVQMIFRARSSSKFPPPGVVAMETHRHSGIDVYLASQAGKLIDPNFRDLVSLHIHFKSNLLGRRKYEWSEMQLDTKRLTGAVAAKYTIPKQAFALYKSAEEHTKIKRHVPWYIWLFVPVALYLIYLLLKIFFGVNNDKAGLISGTASVSANASSTSVVGSNLPGSIPAASISKFDLTPTIDGVLESAPAYSSLVTVKAFPRVMACMSKPNDCTCYTQQLTVYPMPFQDCINRMAGKVFDPYFEPYQAPYAPPDSLPVTKVALE